MPGNKQGDCSAFVADIDFSTLDLLLGQSRGNAVRCTGNEQQMAMRLGLFVMAAEVVRNSDYRCEMDDNELWCRPIIGVT